MICISVLVSALIDSSIGVANGIETCFDHTPNATYPLFMLHPLLHATYTLPGYTQLEHPMHLSMVLPTSPSAGTGGAFGWGLTQMFDPGMGI